RSTCETRTTRRRATGPGSRGRMSRSNRTGRMGHRSGRTAHPSGRTGHPSGRTGYRIALLVIVAAIAALALAPDAFASAGGGSSGFSGGGGEGGGGGGGHGSFIVFYLLWRFALLGHGLGAVILVAAFVIWFTYTRGITFWRARERSGRKQGKTT